MQYDTIRANNDLPQAKRLLSKTVIGVTARQTMHPLVQPKIGAVGAPRGTAPRGLHSTRAAPRGAAPRGLHSTRGADFWIFLVLTCAKY